MGMDDCSYENFDVSEISEFKRLIAENKLSGLNVTIPYKEKVIPYLSSLDDTAEKIGAVNTIKFTGAGLIGYNTDAYGFQRSLEEKLKPTHKKALVLGTGGASKAVAFVLRQLAIEVIFVSRNPHENQLSYEELGPSVITSHQIIVNCTPLGTHPNINARPHIPYKFITPEHLLFDLIYNPEKTKFLRIGEEQGAQIQNGLPMLKFQAEKAWEIWNSDAP